MKLPVLPSLYVVVPCFNPAPGWERKLVGAFLAFKEKAAASFAQISVVIVDDGSDKNVEESAIQFIKTETGCAQWIRSQPNMGKGFALRKGVAAVTADFYLLTDVDFPYTLDSMVFIAQKVAEQGGLAAGSRDAVYYTQVPFFRRVLSKSLRFMLRHFFRINTGDSQCGLKAFDAQAKPIFLETKVNRFLFDLEFLLLARGRVSVYPVPVELRPGITFSKVGFKILLPELKSFWLLFFRR